jgi:hypothetical protein
VCLGCSATLEPFCSRATLFSGRSRRHAFSSITAANREFTLQLVNPIHFHSCTFPIKVCTLRHSRPKLVAGLLDSKGTLRNPPGFGGSSSSLVCVQPICALSKAGAFLPTPVHYRAAAKKRSRFCKSPAASPRKIAPPSSGLLDLAPGFAAVCYPSFLLSSLCLALRRTSPSIRRS